MKELDQAYATLKAAKRHLNEAHDAYLTAIEEFQAVFDDQHSFATRLSQLENGNERLPKGHIKGLIELIFTNNFDGALSFRQVFERIEKLHGAAVSKNTVRQTLYRMAKRHELERYSGKWSEGHALRNQKER